MSEIEGGQDLEIFFKRYTECLNCSLIVELLDHVMQGYLEIMSSKTGVAASDAMNLMWPYKKTELMEYQEGLKGLKREDAADFVKRYEWIGTHGFAGQALDETKVRGGEAGESKVSGEGEPEFEAPRDYEYLVEIGSKLAYYRTYLVEKADRAAYSHWSVIKELGEKYGYLG